MSNMAQALLLETLSTVLNAALANDAIAQHRVGQLAGKSIRFCVSHPLLDFYLQCYIKEIRLVAWQAEPADTTVTADAPQLLLQLLGGRTRASLIGQQVHIEGDTLLLEKLQSALRELDPAFEENLARVLGDDIAMAAGQLARQGLAFGKSLLSRLLDEGTRHMNQDDGALVGRERAGDFAKAVTALRRDTERLAARLEALAARSGDAR